MDSSITSSERSRFGGTVLALSVFRGVVAIALGLFLFFMPTRTAPAVANMVGLFWLTSGVVMLRRSRHDPLVQTMGHGTARFIAVAAIIAGVAVVTRRFSQHVVPRELLVVLLGIVIALSGLLHLIGILRVGGVFRQADRFLHFLLALFELALGLALAAAPLDRNPVMYGIATVWTLAFGLLLLFQAAVQWQEMRKQTQPAPETESIEKQIPDHEGCR